MFKVFSHQGKANQNSIEILPHWDRMSLGNQNKQANKKQMLERLYRGWGGGMTHSYSLLLGLEISVPFPQKTKNRTPM
jgi:hypothetical protein